jgi:hypothetical protein
MGIQLIELAAVAVPDKLEVIVVLVLAVKAVMAFQAL